MVFGSRLSWSNRCLVLPFAWRGAHKNQCLGSSPSILMTCVPTVSQGDACPCLQHKMACALPALTQDYVCSRLQNRDDVCPAFEIRMTCVPAFEIRMICVLPSKSGWRVSCLRNQDDVCPWPQGDVCPYHQNQDVCPSLRNQDDVCLADIRTRLSQVPLHHLARGCVGAVLNCCQCYAVLYGILCWTCTYGSRPGAFCFRCRNVDLHSRVQVHVMREHCYWVVWRIRAK